MPKILVVEDERNLRRLYRDEFERGGYDVVTAASAEECLACFDDEHPDVVVMDIRMPGMDGLEAMGRILERQPDVPVVLNSAYSSYKDNFLSWTADAYVVKSSDTRQLVDTVGRVLSRPGPGLSPSP